MAKTMHLGDKSLKLIIDLIDEELYAIDRYQPVEGDDFEEMEQRRVLLVELKKALES